MPRIQINASSYGTPVEVVEGESGMVVWTVSIRDLAEAGSEKNLTATGFSLDNGEAILVEYQKIAI